MAERRPIEQSAIAERRLARIFERAWLLGRLAVERELENGPATRGRLRRAILRELRGLHPEGAIARVGRTVAESMRRQIRKASRRDIPRGGEAIEAVIARWTRETMSALRSILVEPTRRTDARKRGAAFSLLELAARAVASVDPAEAAGQVAQATRGAVRRASATARASVLRLSGQANRTIQRSAGITRYIWRTKQDDRVRDLHASREGQLFSWDDPPSDGHPGDAYNCRCVAIPTS